jgi:hypothetical protein
MKQMNMFLVMRFLRASLCVVLIASGTLVYGQSFNYEPNRPNIKSPYLSSLGGTYSAIESGFNTLFTNPAALTYVQKEVSIARISFHATGAVLDLPAAFRASDVTQELLNMVVENNGLYMGANITGPIAAGKVDTNFGFGFFNQTVVEVDVASVGSARLSTGEEFLLIGAYGLQILEKDTHALALGFQLNGFFQSFTEFSGTAVSVLDTFTSLDFQSIPVIMSAGIGVDVGVLYRLGNRFSAGIVCRDLYTPVFSTRYANMGDYLSGSPNSDTVKNVLFPNLSIGVAMPIPYPTRWTTISSWTFMADYRNALEIFRPLYRNPILNVGLGTEMKLLKVVSVRLGISETYPAMGLGLDLSFCEIELAMYGTELGLDPGSRPLYNAIFSVAFEY